MLQPAHISMRRALRYETASAVLLWVAPHAKLDIELRAFLECDFQRLKPTVLTQQYCIEKTCNATGPVSNTCILLFG